MNIHYDFQGFTGTNFYHDHTSITLLFYFLAQYKIRLAHKNHPYQKYV